MFVHDSGICCGLMLSGEHLKQENSSLKQTDTHVTKPHVVHLNSDLIHVEFHEAMQRKVSFKNTEVTFGGLTCRCASCLLKAGDVLN